MMFLSRDYLQANYAEGWVGGNEYLMVLYTMSIFVFRVLGWSIVGRTNFSFIDGSWMIASGTASPNRAGINYGTGKEYEVGIPSGVRTVSSADINRTLVLRSTSNPTKNAGLFRITGINATNNRYIIDYRSTEYPPAEADDSFDWWLYEKDFTACGSLTGKEAAAGSSGYRARGTSTCSRIIFQSPHATGWQLRLCYEADTGIATASTYISATIGFDGTVAGDFVVGGRHLHIAHWYDVRGVTTNYVDGNGTGHSRSASRWTLLGDSGGQAVLLVVRERTTSTNWGHGLYGVPDNEPTPLPSDAIYRVFQMCNWNDASATGITFEATDNQHGNAFGYQGVPISGYYSTWSTYGANNVPANYASAGDNPRTGATDLVAVQFVAGQFDKFKSAANLALHGREPRVLGFAPMIRHGRKNFSAWTTTTDKAWLHTTNGYFIPWNGPTPLA